MGTPQLLLIKPAAKTPTETKDKIELAQDFKKHFQQRCPNTAFKSLSFVKQFLAMSISNLTSVYQLFPQEAYYERKFGKTPIQILHGSRDRNTKFPEVNLYLSWMKGVGDALEKKYLSELTIGLFAKGDPDNVIESFTYRFTYDKEGCVSVNGLSSLLKDKDYTKKIIEDTNRLFSNSYVMAKTSKLSSCQTHGSLTLQMKIEYVDATPLEYRAPYFDECSDLKSFSYSSKPLVTRLGQVATPWHTLQLEMKSTDRSAVMVSSLDLESGTPAANSPKKKEKTVVQAKTQEIMGPADQPISFFMQRTTPKPTTNVNQEICVTPIKNVEKRLSTSQPPASKRSRAASV